MSRPPRLCTSASLRLRGRVFCCNKRSALNASRTQKKGIDCQRSCGPAGAAALTPSGEDHVEKEEQEEFAVVVADGVGHPRAEVVHVEDDAARDRVEVRAGRPVARGLRAELVALADGGRRPGDGLVPLERGGARVHQRRLEPGGEEAAQQDQEDGHVHHRPCLRQVRAPANATRG